MEQSMIHGARRCTSTRSGTFRQKDGGQVRLAALLAALLAFFPPLHARVFSPPDSSGWFWQNPLPQGNTLYDVTTTNVGYAVAVGGSGTIIRTSDGGVTWGIVRSVGNTRTALTSISFVDPSTGWAVGENGKGFFTSNGGATWIPRGNGVGSVSLTSVKFLTTTVGWSVGKLGYIFKTTNSGSLWVSQPSGTLKDLYDVSPFNDTGFVVGDVGAIRRTTNGGASWDSAGFIAFSNYKSSYFADPRNGWVTDYVGNVFRTTTGGDSWTRQLAANNLALNDIKFFTGTQTGIAVGEKGVMSHTLTSGAFWTADTLDSTITLYAAALRSPVFAWAVGEHGRIFLSNNATIVAPTWAARSSGSIADLRDVSFPDAANGWAVGQNGLVLKTQNGGGTWTPQASGATGTLNGIAMISASKGFAVGDNGALIKTTNGGTSWEVVLTPTTLPTFNAIRFGDALHGTAVGNLGTILHTSDGGNQWNAETLGVNVTLTSVAYSTSFNVWAVGGKQGVGYIYRSTNAGATWDSVYIQPSLQLTDVYFLNPVTGIAVGLIGSSSTGRANIIMTTDGGAEWIPRNSPEQVDFRRAFFVGDSIGWIVGDGGTMIRTLNGGQTWNSLSTGVQWDLHALHFADSLTGWIAGDGGSILKSTDGGGPIVDYTPPPPPMGLPQQITLLPNYPNPFNPSTNIAYELAIPTDVKVIIYDILGHKVREFDLGHQAAGRYDGKQYPPVAWDGFDQYGNTLPSGVYFYTIVTTELRQTSKMLLVR